MKVVQFEGKSIYGYSIQTNNTNESNPETAKISKVWEIFASKVSVDYKNGERVYGVYYDYESDAKGNFSVLAGYEKENEGNHKVIIEKGSYLVFSARAKNHDDKSRIDAVIQTWGLIWQYFNNDNSKYKRAYITDFEYYKEQTEIEIYISIK